MQAVILANGELRDRDSALKLVSNAGLIIAADGGALHCIKLGIDPQILIGDLDSVEESLIKELSSKGVRVVKFDSDKDETDLELALNYAVSKGAEEILILGGFGKRLDHSLGNLTLAANERYTEVKISFYTNGDWFHILRREIDIKGEPGQTISLIPLGGSVEGVKSSGLHWQLENEALPFGTSRGISNIIKSEKASVSIESGVLLVIINKMER